MISDDWKDKNTNITIYLSKEIKMKFKKAVKEGHSNISKTIKAFIEEVVKNYEDPDAGIEKLLRR